MSFSNEELFTGTAAYYSKFRIDYPTELIERLLSFCQSKGNGKLLDLGCGTGQLSIPMHSYFEEVIGIDISQEMVDEARRIGREQNTENMRFITMESEKMDKELGQFDLIVCGNAFHWMDRELVLDKSYDLLKPSGGMVILAGGSIWTGKQYWQKEISKIIQKWLGEKRKAGTGEYRVKNKLHEAYIHESEFELVKKGSYHFLHEWSMESLLGYLYSTSFCNRRLLGENVDAFEEELKKALLRIKPEGIFQEEVKIAYFFLKKQKEDLS